MTVGIFGKKIGMTQIFDANGSVIPVTLVKTDPCQICQIKTVKTDGYSAIQIGYLEENFSKITKPLQGHLKKSGTRGYRKFGEFRVNGITEYILGTEVNVEAFSVGQKVRITGISIGKGFAGNQKRNNFSRGPMTHGSKNHRLPGSIGAGSTPGRVYPGKKMAGQLGNKKTTIKNSEVLFVSPEENILVLRGSLPGKAKNILKIAANN
jgi:large subunit ribosomal protein L3